MGDVLADRLKQAEAEAIQQELDDDTTNGGAIAFAEHFGERAAGPALAAALDVLADEVADVLSLGAFRHG